MSEIDFLNEDPANQGRETTEAKNSPVIQVDRWVEEFMKRRNLSTDLLLQGFFEELGGLDYFSSLHKDQPAVKPDDIVTLRLVRLPQATTETGMFGIIFTTKEGRELKLQSNGEGFFDLSWSA